MSEAQKPIRWLTYKAAGELLGIAAESVKRRAIRDGWERREGNDRAVLCAVPEALLTEREGVTVPGDAPEPSPPPPPGLEAIAAELAKIAEDARQARAEADRLRGQVAEGERELARLRALLLEEVAFPPRQAPPPGFRVVHSPAAGLYHWHRIADGTLGPGRADRWSARRGAMAEHRKAGG